MIPVIDVFAGPGGLGEGFAAFLDAKGHPPFDVSLSIEVEKNAFETLKLRTLFRSIPEGKRRPYYQLLRGEIPFPKFAEIFSREVKLVDERCWNARLGPGGVGARTVQARVESKLRRNVDWVLVGGPPCQAYSLAGRSRNQGIPYYNPKKDVRQRLYVEYLQILSDLAPSVFVMENVKGLLSAKIDNTHLFRRIVDDLMNPVLAMSREGRSVSHSRRKKYSIFSLSERDLFNSGDLRGSVVHAEEFGVPQARHRVILLGVRDDLRLNEPNILHPAKQIPLSAVLSDLPPLRSGMSEGEDSKANWEQVIKSQMNSRWLTSGVARVTNRELARQIRDTIRTLESPAAGRGGEFLREISIPKYAAEWYVDPDTGGVYNHSSRSHISGDVFRYLYAASYAEAFGRSPTIDVFPTDLMPNHLNLRDSDLSHATFADRFRVQLWNRPSTTVVSHISRDGHYYIHPDPRQCRSLTVREAARLQTFPDNYFFCGPRTSQYVQVGNAVPPILASQIAAIVAQLLK
jgi:DNA (cytosine-5)-methyltransferase 1